jgi:hypothetical protein
VAAKRILKTVGFVAGVGAAVYGTLVWSAWNRYGYPKPPSRKEEDPLLDEFMPDYDVVERHSVVVNASAAEAYRAACEMDLENSSIVQILFKSRALIFGAIPGREHAGHGMITRMKALGWGKLAELPGREIVMGSVTQPWEADVVFRAITTDRFAAFHEKGFVKIAWTLRVDPLTETTSTFRTETRAVACGSLARSKFRPYWAFLSPGIALIRVAMLRQLKRELKVQQARLLSRSQSASPSAR